MGFIKSGVRIEGIRAELILGLLLISEVFRKYKVELIITEVTGGQHMVNSLHYTGMAADIRSKHISNINLKLDILQECRETLGSNFDMILENSGCNNEHYHVEVDFK